MVDGGKRICARDGCTKRVGERIGRGRPRKYCEAHREPDRHRQGYLRPSWRAECSVCGKSVATSRQSADDVVCHDCRALCTSEFVAAHSRYIPPSRRAICGACGVMMWSSVSAKAGVTSRCKACRTSDKQPRRRCRCDECRAKNTERARKYRAKRVAEGRPVVYKRQVEERVCPGCGSEFSARVDMLEAGKGIYCSKRCRCLVEFDVDIDSPDFVRSNRFRISEALRLSLYERDDFVCWLCGEVTRPGDDPSSDWYPSLDHVLPRSRGGSDDPENLRCAHRLCNSIKGAQVVDDAV